MKMLNKSIILALLLLPIVSKAQDVNSVLEQIKNNNKQLKAYKELVKAEKYEAGIGMLPSNPEISYGYFPGSPSAAGNKKTWGVSQQIDFPTTYSYRRGVLKNKRIISEKKYDIGRQEVLLDAKLSVLEYIYLKNFERTISLRLELSKSLLSGIEKKFKSGESNILEYNKIMILNTNLNKNFSIVRSKVEKVKEHIKFLNAGVLPQLPKDSKGVLLIKENDLIANVIANLPQLDILEKELRLSNRQVKLSRSETLPKFNIGFESEDAEGIEYKGIKVGMSIPLWGDRNKVKAVKAKVVYQEAQLENTKASIIAEYRENYKLALALRDNIKGLKSALLRYDIKVKLRKAFEAGELSQHEYFGELEYYFSTEDSLLELENEYEQLVAKLYCYKL